jgi:hypothetical protein
VEIVVLKPSPVKLYQTPNAEIMILLGGVSDIVLTVDPARLVVPQGSDVADPHTSFEGRIRIEITAVAVHPPELVAVIV